MNLLRQPCAHGFLIQNVYTDAHDAAALQLGREFTGIEASPGYVAMADRRLSSVQGVL